MKLIVRIINKIFQKLKNLKNKLLEFYYSKLFYQCGEELKIFGDVTIYGAEKIKIGDRCRINEGVMLAGRGEIIIGNDVTFSPYSVVLSAGYDLKSRAENIESKIHDEKVTEIGDKCWVSTGAIILPGVKVSGKGVIIAAGAVVTKDVSDNYVILAGIPARIIKRIDY